MQFESKLLVESFLDNSWLEKNLSENTLSSYKNDLSKFYKFTEKNNKNVILADHFLIISYLSILIDQASSKTISKYFGFKSFTHTYKILVI